ncbi:MAG: FHA domain-containing protein [candidate division Zixibacteria bacterium]
MEPSYLEFFELARPPFARLSQPSQIFDTDQYALLTDHLIGATEQPDCLVTIFGASGSGKTMLLNRYIDSLDDDVYFAAIDENCKGEMPFYCSFLQQLGFGEISGSLEELRRITKEFLINRGMADDPILLFIDNAHLVSPVVLEQIRWISATKIGNRRAVSIVITGNSDLASIMDSPAMQAIEFSNQVDFNIRVYTEEETTNYVSHRLKLAGDDAAVSFSKEAHPLIYKFTGGNPKLINKLCNAVLMEAHSLESKVITKDLVRTVADSWKLTPQVESQKGKGRRKIDPGASESKAQPQAEEQKTEPDPSTKESIALPPPKTALSEFTVEGLLKRISSLSEQLGELQEDKKQYDNDLGSRDKVIEELQEDKKQSLKDLESRDKVIEDLQEDNKQSVMELDSRDRVIEEIQELVQTQTDEIERLATAAGSNASEIKRLNKSLSDTTVALQKSEKAHAKLSSNLQKNQISAKIAKTNISEFKSELKDLSREKTDLNATILDLKAELRLANKRVAKTGGGTSKRHKDAHIAAFEVVRNGTVEQRLDVANDQSRIMIGRGEDCELCLDSKVVSRHHALIVCKGKKTIIEDLNSANGTSVNAEATKRSELHAGDTINIGHFEIRLKEA